MWVLGLTGGIASGKSAAADAFARCGATVIDTDLLAREAVAPGAPALAEIAAAFGPDVLAADGGLDRAAMRARVFADPGARARLEGILHPRIRALAAARIAAAARAEAPPPYCVLVVPLLVESGMQTMVDRILVIDVDTATQLQRTMARDGIGADLARAMLAAQADRDTRLAAADDVIVNDANLATLERRIDALHAHYLVLARRRDAGPE
ncbi:dephospho-CoA kinase [Plasticicumulans lactativorans]|uniref:Dephospho-CoA kinase n=1 Tax=Plasticicumulans lactativorans TaxID=1133106 RepID=A0A4R2L4K4_9GAMM|nr:dephospho-CoA kinase [Plasticicumulans lactativorans]TCO80187.1 dephospho-CoA kinase [Plasticicumulans lactativorans]